MVKSLRTSGFCLFFLFSFLRLISANPAEFKPESPEKKFYSGEKLIYEISYLGVPVGRSVSEVEEATYQNRKAYHFHVFVTSYRGIDFFYKVRDEHHSYVDAKTLETLGYERKIQEGRRKVYEKIIFDPAAHEAHYFDAQGKEIQKLETQPGTQDALSCGYWSRTYPFQAGDRFFIPVHAEEKNWNLEVKTYEKKTVTLSKIGKFEAVRLEPMMEFQGIFFRKGKVEGWVSLDKRRIPLTMKVKIPVLGMISASLISYEPGQSL
jgi:hypothetical protein